MSVSLPFPFIRLNRTEFIFSPFPLLVGMSLRPLGSAGNSPASPLGQPGLLTIRHAHSAPKVRNGYVAYGNGVTERQNGHGLRKRLRKRIRMNGNVTLETRRDPYQSTLRYWSNRKPTGPVTLTFSGLPANRGSHWVKLSVE